jgi:hypothetical protein
MTQTKETRIEPAEIISCEDTGSQWKIKVKWQNNSLNPRGFEEYTYMVKSIEDKIPFEKGLYAFTVSRGSLKKDKDGTADWMYYWTTHEVNTPEQQDALSQTGGTTGNWLTDEEEKPQVKTYEQIQVSTNDSITNQVILKELALNQRLMMEKDQIKYSSLAESRADLKLQWDIFTGKTEDRE